MNPGDVYRTRNGNLYLVLPHRKEAYIGNFDMERCDPSLPLLSPTAGAVVVTSLKESPWTPIS
jgi:hypothetical protein